MIIQIVVCILASAGILMIVWTVSAVLLLPAAVDCVLMAASGDAEDLQQRVRSYTFLVDSSLVRTQLVIVDCGLSKEGQRIASLLVQQNPDIVLCPETAIPEVWKTERLD